MTSLDDIVNHGTDTGLYQRALDLAEDSRNLHNAYAGSTSNSYEGTSGSEGGAGGARTVNFNDPLKPPPVWKGPDAYGLENVTNGMQFAQGDEDNLNAFLAHVRKFDPNANFTTGIHQSGGEGGVDSTYYTLNFDDSKLPKMVNPNLVGAGNYGTDRLFRTDDAAFAVDPHYGVMTSPRNIKPDERAWLDVVGPAAVMLFGIMAGGGFPLLSTFLNAPRVLSTLGNGGSPIDFIPGGSTARRLFNPPGG